MKFMAGSHKAFVVCVHNEGYSVSLEVRKIYEVLQDPDAASHHLLRIVDESGEDYLYPEDMFASIKLPRSLQEALHLAG